MKLKMVLAIVASLVLISCGNESSTPEVPEDQVSENWYDKMPRESWSRFERMESAQDWFEVYKLTDNTYAILENNNWQEAIGYVLIGTEKALVVDTLMGIGDIKMVVDEITDLPVIVMNTHTHFDHNAGNYQFDTIYGVDTPYSNENAQGKPNARIKGSVGPETFWKNIPDTFDQDTFQVFGYEVDHYVTDGEIIALGDRDIEIVFIPGHSPDSVLLIDRKNRMMMTGDSFYPAPIYVNSDASNFQDFFLSSQIMFGFRNEVDYLLPGHNETMLSSDYLNELRAATMAIINPSTPYTPGTDRRNYDFGDFSIVVKDPLDMGIAPE